MIRLDSQGTAVRVQVGPPEQRPYEAKLPQGALDACIGEVAGLLRAGAGLAVPGRDAARTRAEEAAGRALGALLGQAPGVRERLLYLLGELRGRGEAAVLVLDCADEGARGLPWELLALEHAPLEALGEAVVARLVAGPRPQPVRWIGQPRLTTWAPDPTDPLCMARVQGLADLARARGLSAPLGVSDDITVLPEVQSLLHVICHGVADAGGGRLLTGGGEQGAGTAGHLLTPHLRQARAVVLEVCEAGAADGPELDNLACRLVAAGARACVSARGRLSMEAIAAFDEAFIDALSGGDAITDAVAAGRRAVRALASPRPDARWHLLSLFVSSLAELEQPAERVLALSGWPAAAPDAARWLAEAARLLGVEHLLLALPEGAGELSLARHTVAPRREALLAVLGGLQRRGALGTPTPSPRLDRIRAALPPRFDAGALWAALAAEPGLSRLLDLSVVVGAMTFDGATLDALAAAERAAPAGLEVVGGPEDGRILHLDPGDWVGRAEARGGPGLYPAPGPVDPYLSRTHLRWLGEGRVSLARPAQLQRPGQPELPVSGEVQLNVGDLLVLSPITRLLAVEAGCSTAA